MRIIEFHISTRYILHRQASSRIVYFESCKPSDCSYFEKEISKSIGYIQMLVSTLGFGSISDPVGKFQIGLNKPKIGS